MRVSVTRLALCLAAWMTAGLAAAQAGGAARDITFIVISGKQRRALYELLAGHVSGPGWSGDPARFFVKSLKPNAAGLPTGGKGVSQ